MFPQVILLPLLAATRPSGPRWPTSLRVCTQGPTYSSVIYIAVSCGHDMIITVMEENHHGGLQKTVALSQINKINRAAQ